MTLKRTLQFILGLIAAWNLSSAAETTSFPEFKTASIDGAQGNFTRDGENFHLTNTSSHGTFFVYQKFVGNGQIIARVRTTSQKSGQAGLIFRQSLESKSLAAGIFRDGTNTVFERVINLAQPPVATVLTNEIFEWLRIVREGNALSGFHSSDGTNWIQFSADSIELSETILAGFVIRNLSAADFEHVQMTSAHLTSPANNSTFTVPTNIFLQAEIVSLRTNINRVEFFSGANKIGETDSISGKMIWSNVLAGSQSITAKILNTDGSTFFTEPNLCKIKIPVSKATFLELDETTRGNWNGRYGAEGFAMANVSTNLPVFVQWKTTALRTHTWINSTEDVRGLSRTNSVKRIASSWHHPREIELELLLADGHPHQFSIYFLDWDLNHRATLVEINDLTNDKLLDARKIDNFAAGKYLSWTLTGHLKIKLTALNGNASFSGIFFDSSSK